MGTQQVSGVICARTETEGKGAGYLFCSPEVPGAGGLRMLNNNTLTLDNGGGSSCTQVHITGRTRELSHDRFCLHYWYDLTRTLSSDLTVYCNSQSSLLHGTKKSAQWNNVMYVPGLWPIESCHTVWGLMPLLLALSGVLPSGQDSSRSHSHRCSLILPQDHDLNYVMLSVCIFVCCI